METQNPQNPQMIPHTTATETHVEFASGATVIYALHGKCNILSVENRSVGGESIRFYKLEIQKSPLSRSNRQEPAIWVPIASAKERGMRAPITASEAAPVQAIFSTREYYFELNTPFHSIQPRLEAAIRNEGAIGLAKVASYLFVFRRRQVVPASELIRFQESINKLLLRELSEATGEQPRTIEERMNKAMKHKLLPDN